VRPAQNNRKTPFPIAKTKVTPHLRKGGPAGFPNPPQMRNGVCGQFSESERWASPIFSARYAVANLGHPSDSLGGLSRRCSVLLADGLKCLRENRPVEESHGATNQRVPHISLVFCEMWDATDPRLAVPGEPKDVDRQPWYPTSREKRARYGAPFDSWSGQKLDCQVLTQGLKGRPFKGPELCCF
jgi:hypothetical protein